MSLHGLTCLGAAQRNRLLTWLDQSGLALYFLQALERNGLVADLDSCLADELLRRRRDNKARVASLLEDFTRVVETFTAVGIPYVVLKGFSLVPEFCPAPELRHHTDIDLLIPPDAARLATEEAKKLGYALECIEPSGEVRLATPSSHAPSARDYLYTVPWQRRLELHVSAWEEIEHVRIASGSGWLSRRVWRQFRGVRYPALAPADAVVYQVLHIFRHVLQGWIRLGWLYETGLRLSHDRGNEILWSDVVGRTACDQRMRDACAFIFALAQKVFAAELPRPIADEVMRLRLPLSAWIERYIPGWEFADLPGDHRSLIVHRQFVEQDREWQQVRRARVRRLLSNMTMENLLRPAFLARAFRKRVVYAWTRLRWAGALSKLAR